MLSRASVRSQQPSITRQRLLKARVVSSDAPPTPTDTTPAEPSKELLHGTESGATPLMSMNDLPGAIFSKMHAMNAYAALL